MIQNCQQFEDRIQELMDQRIDPETDEMICAHVAECETCNESMMAFSVLHTTYLNDSDSMKIKLENLGLHEVLAKRKAEKPERSYLFAIVASLAGALLLFTALTNGFLQSNQDDPAVAVSMPDLRQSVTSKSIDLNVFLEVKRSLDQNDIYGSFSELPGIRPFKVLSTYFDWLHESWSNPNEKESNPDVGRRFEFNPHQQYSSNLLVAARI